MEHNDYKAILDSLWKIGVYVIRKENHEILYYNKWVAQVSPTVRLGTACHDVWNGSCHNCPLLTIKDRHASRSLSYNESFGGVVDITASRILWNGSIPAFVISVTPRPEIAGYTYRKIVQVDLNQGCYNTLKSESGQWPPKGDNLSLQLALLVQDGVIHPDDSDRFISFIRLDNLRSILASEHKNQTCIYRRRLGEGFRWNLMELIPGFDYSEDSTQALLCIRDVHDVLREGLEREDANIRNTEIICSLGEQSFNIYTIDLAVGVARPVRENGQMQNSLSFQILMWDIVCGQIKKRLHPAYQDAFAERFSLEGLRLAKKSGEQKAELLCQWEGGGSYRYIDVTATFGQSYAVLALRDVDEHIRQELIHTHRDMQMAAILKSRYSVMNTVNLDNGQCERTNLNEFAKPQNTMIGDYSYYIKQAVSQFVHPEDAECYRSILSLEHLREKARNLADDYGEEICQYRLKGEPVRWIELHVIYTRQEGKITVNILGHDITKEKCQADEKRRALQERSYIISSMSSLFFSTYYVNLEKNTFRTVTQLGRAADILGSEVACDAALRIYAENFVHPDDREEYLKVMNVENWRSTLRWWNPSVAVEYRKLPDFPENAPDEYSWVRATAVVAQLNMDDTPKTVVYMAQDIADGKADTKRH